MQYIVYIFILEIIVTAFILADILSWSDNPDYDEHEDKLMTSSFLVGFKNFNDDRTMLEEDDEKGRILIYILHSFWIVILLYITCKLLT